MKRQIKTLLATPLRLLVLVLILVACGAPPATQAPLPTEAPAATEAPAPTEAPEPTEAEAAPTEAEAAPTEATVAGPQGTVIVAVSGEPGSLDPAFTTNELTDGSIARQYMQTPLFHNSDGSVSPQLAESWDIVDDTNIVFHLREGVTFSNGEPWNAQAFEYSWHWATQEEMHNTDVWRKVTAVEIQDDYTVQVTFEAPDPILLSNISTDLWMYPPEYTAEVGIEAYGQAPIGTGPFMFVEWVPGDHVTFEANPNYYEPGRPKVQTIIYKPIPEDATRAAALQAGDVDMARLVPVELVPQLEEAEGVEVVRALSTRTYSMLFNNVQTGIDTPLESAQVRQAMNYAVDKQAIIDTILDGQAVAMNSFIGTIMFGYDDSLPVMEYDPDRAIALLTEAGYPDGFEIDMSCPAGAYAKVEEICQAIAGYLEGVGIIANLEIMESGAFWDLEASKQATPLFFDGWGSRALDASDQIWGAFVSDAVVEGGSGWGNWYDEKLYDLWQQQAFTLDQDTRAAVLSEMAAYMQEEPPAIFLWQVYNFEAVRDYVDGYTMYPDDVQYLWDVEVNK